jgi:hypothetical protein
METKKITDTMREALRKPLPKEAIKQHPTKTFLSTIKAIYVVERLNDVFGVGEWTISNEVISANDKWIVVKSVFTVNGYNIRIEQFGGNDNADPGDAYKGAATDALTKIGSYLEIGIEVFKGLADKAKSETTTKTETTTAKTEDNDKPWINDTQITKVIERIKNGEVELKQSTLDHFKVSKVNREKLKAA